MMHIKRPISERDKLTQERLLFLFAYDKETGLFSRRAARGNSKQGNTPGWLDLRRYVVMAVDKHDYRAHRLAWLYMTGAWPEGDIDHINGDTSDNRWTNLRDVSKTKNAENQRKAHSNNASGILGVSARKSGIFVAQIRVHGVLKYLGSFKDSESAAAAYMSAKRSEHEGCTI